MNNKIIIAGIFLLILSTIISAQDTPTTNPSLETTSNKTKIDLKIQTEKTDSLLEREVEMSEPVKKIVGIILGFNEGEKITWTIMVGIITFMIFIFIFLTWVFELMPFFNGAGKILGALLVTLLISVTKGIKETVEFYFKATDSVNILEEWSTGALIFFVILIIGIMIIARKVIKSLKKIKELDKAEIDGTNIGWNIATLNKLKEEMFRKDG